MSDTKKLSLIAFSGDFDKLTAVFTLATVPLLLDTRLTSSLLSGAGCHQEETGTGIPWR